MFFFSDAVWNRKRNQNSDMGSLFALPRQVTERDGSGNPLYTKVKDRDEWRVFADIEEQRRALGWIASLMKHVSDGRQVVHPRLYRDPFVYQMASGGVSIVIDMGRFINDSTGEVSVDAVVLYVHKREGVPTTGEVHAYSLRADGHGRMDADKLKTESDSMRMGPWGQSTVDTFTRNLKAVTTRTENIRWILDLLSGLRSDQLQCGWSPRPPSEARSWRPDDEADRVWAQRGTVYDDDEPETPGQGSWLPTRSRPKQWETQTTSHPRSPRQGEWDRLDK